MLVNDSSNRLNELAAFPLIYPNAGKVNNDGYYANEVLDDVAPAWWDAQNRMMNLPPIFNWGGRIGAAPPNQRYPGWLNINRTQDVAASITKVMGRHTMKAGFYNNHSFKAQNVGAGGGLSFQGTVDFGNDTNNADRHRLRLRQRRHGRVHPLPAGVGLHRRPDGLRQHRVLHPGQLEVEQPDDAGLRRALHAPGTAVRQEPGDVELLP